MSFNSLSPQDLSNLASRDFILNGSSVEEQIGFIRDQIKDPFDSGDTNFFKQLSKMVNQDQLDDICVSLLNQISDIYADMDFSISEIDERIAPYFKSIYKFFVRNIHKQMYIFLREYIFAAKNRKILVADYLSTKLPNYPKEQYGKKEYYVLINKLPNILKDIFEDAKSNDITLLKFISYIERSGNMPYYVEHIRELNENGIINERGVVANIFELFFSSDQYDVIVNKLQMAITEELINPYLKENNLMDLKTPMVELVEDDDISDDDDEDEKGEENND